MDKSSWDIDFRYVFSGKLTTKMKDMVEDTLNFVPFDMLLTQLERPEMKKYIEWKQEGFIRWILCDSGAFSVHTGKADTTQDQYIDYINEISDDVDMFAQLDTIPGKFGQPKKAEDYIESAEKSWENFIYMRDRIKHKNKLMPIFHYGEDTKYLKRMLDYRDSEGEQLHYIGLSPANDASKKDRMIYLDSMYRIIEKSSNPSIKTHLYGFTSLDAISKFPCYSADSITHRLLSGYNKIISQNFGIISVTRQPRSQKTKSNQSFLDVACEDSLKTLREEFEEFGIDADYLKRWGFDTDDVFEAISQSNELRIAITMRNIQKMAYGEYSYKPSNTVRSIPLF